MQPMRLIQTASMPAEQPGHNWQHAVSGWFKAPTIRENTALSQTEQRTLDGDAMTLSDNEFVINSGDADGLNVNISGNGIAQPFIGTSLKRCKITASMTKFNGTLSVGAEIT